MKEINTRFLITLALEIQVSSLGDTPYGRRRMFHFDGGSFDGPKLKGKVLPGGGGWSLIRRDDVMEVDARLILETNDNHQIYAAWKGLAQRTVDNALMRYFIVHMHRLLDPATDATRQKT